MPARTHTLTMSGPMLERGFWLYVWRLTSPHAVHLYVGRTGDSSSPHAQSPIVRMGQHLGHQPNQNALRRNMESNGISPEHCSLMELVTHGAIFPEADGMDAHRVHRDKISALEKKLADSLTDAGYNVLNEVKSRKELDPELWRDVRAAFGEHFPKLLSK
jgi:hypothetical protein